MANDKLINRLANYQMVSDLLGTYLDYHQKEREMVMKYGETDADSERRIIKEGGKNYYADTGDPVLDIDDTTDAEGKRELYQWKNKEGVILSGSYEEGEEAETTATADPDWAWGGYHKMGTFDAGDGPGGVTADPQLYQITYMKDGIEKIGQGNYADMGKMMKDYPDATYVKLPTGTPQDKNAAGEVMYAWDDEKGVYNSGNKEAATASGQPYFLMGKYSRPSAASAKANMIQQDGVWYDISTQAPVLTDVVKEGPGNAYHFNWKTGKFYYYPEDKPEDLEVVDIPGWSAGMDAANTQIISHQGSYKLINKADGNVISSGSFEPAAGAETSETRKAAANEYINKLAATYNISKGKLSQLYGTVTDDPDFSEDDLTQAKAIADDIQKNTSTRREETRKGQVATLSKSANQSIHDKFGPGQGGNVQRFSMPGQDFEFTVSSKSGKAWSPDRASGTLARIFAIQKQSGTNMGFITSDEGARLVGDVSIAKHTDYSSVNGGYRLAKGVMTSTNAAKTKTEGVTEVKDGAGNRWAYAGDVLFRYDAEYGGVWRKVNPKMNKFKINVTPQGTTLYPNQLGKWFLTEMGKYRYLDK